MSLGEEIRKFRQRILKFDLVKKVNRCIEEGTYCRISKEGEFYCELSNLYRDINCPYISDRIITIKREWENGFSYSPYRLCKNPFIEDKVRKQSGKIH